MAQAQKLKTLHFTFWWDRNVTKEKQRVYIAISVGLIAYLGRTETLRREIERLQPHLGETEIPIGETDFPRVCDSGYDI